jgi:hypothetical protein
MVHEPILSFKFKFVDGRLLERETRPDGLDEILA